MAEKRMFSKTITESDAFLDMPLSTQALYFHLCMYADDDGFLNGTRKIMRMIGSTQNEYDILKAKNFIIEFDDGIVVIKHWLMHNYLRKDRYKPTQYEKEKAMLFVKSNKVYTLDSEQGLPLGIPMVDTDKYSIDKSSIDKSSNNDVIYRSFKHLKVTKDENKKLVELGYKQEQVDSIYDSIENYSKNKNYTSLYLTARKWIKKEYGEPSTKQTKAIKRRDDY